MINPKIPKPAIYFPFCLLCRTSILSILCSHYTIVCVQYNRFIQQAYRISSVSQFCLYRSYVIQLIMYKPLSSALLLADFVLNNNSFHSYFLLTINSPLPSLESSNLLYAKHIHSFYRIISRLCSTQSTIYSVSPS